MTGKQRIALVTAILLFKAGTINFTALKQILLKDFLNIKTSNTFRYLTPKSQQLKAAENFNRLADCLDSLFSRSPVASDTPHGSSPDEPSQLTINLEIPNQFLPVIPFNHQSKIINLKLKYYGPATAFADLSFFEFRMASYYYSQFIEKQNEQDLDRLIALLYRPAKSFWFIRKRLKNCDGIKRENIDSHTNPNRLEARAKRVSRLPFAVKYTILLYVAGSFSFIRSGKPEIDGKEIDLERLYKNEPDGESIGMSGLLFSMAESGIFGNIDDTDKQNIYTILARMYQLMLISEETERKFKKNAEDKRL